MKGTAKEIAEMLNVSPATVSLAINNKPGISAEMRDKVLETIQKLGYENILLRKNDNLGSTIGFLVFQCADIINEQPFYTYILENINEEASKYNYNIYFIKANSTMQTEKLQKIIFENYCEGLIVFATEMANTDVEKLSQLFLPTVYLDNTFGVMHVDAISIDNRQGIFDGIDYLVKAGHERIGYIKSKTQINSFDERYDHYKEALEVYNLRYREEDTVSVRYGELVAFYDLYSYANEAQEMPTAFLADNDLLASAAIEAFKYKGYRIPEDISIVGFDDRPLCRKTQPPLTTVKVFKKSFLEHAFRLLDEKINGKREYSVKIKVGTKMVKRSSVKKIN